MNAPILNRIASSTNEIKNDIEPIKAANEVDLEEGVYNVINAIIGILGLVAVVVIIFGGVQYMTSAGDSGKVKKAKDTILYGVIGLIICIIAAAIVNFVVRNITGNGQQQSSGGSSIGVCTATYDDGHEVAFQVPRDVCVGSIRNTPNVANVRWSPR